MKILNYAELNGIQFSKASSKLFFPLGFTVTYLIKPNCQTPRSLVVLLSGELAGSAVEDESLGGGGVLPTIEWIKEDPEEEHAAMETKDNNAAPEDEERVEREEEEGDNQEEEEVKEEEEEDEAVSGRD